MKNAYLLLLFLLSLLISCKNKTNTLTRETSNKIAPTGEMNIIEKGTEITTNLTAIVPDGFFILDSILPSVGQPFIILVLAPVLEKNSEDFSDAKRRLVILEKKDNAFSQICSNDEVVLCKHCGGIFGDPYNGIDLKNNVLKINNYGGSAWRWSENYTFRFQNNDWQLIGATYDSYFNAKDCNGEEGTAGRQLEDINFAAGKMQILHTDGDNCKPFEDYIKKFEKKIPISLNNFPGVSNQWPCGKIKDGDGKE